MRQLLLFRGWEEWWVDGRGWEHWGKTVEGGNPVWHIIIGSLPTNVKWSRFAFSHQKVESLVVEQKLQISRLTVELFFVCSIFFYDDPCQRILTEQTIWSIHRLELTNEALLGHVCLSILFIWFFYNGRCKQNDQSAGLSWTMRLLLDHVFLLHLFVCL